MQKPGMAKYTAHRGPWPEDPCFLAWHQRDLAEWQAGLAQAQADGDRRLINLFQRRIRESQRIIRNHCKEREVR